MKKQALKSNLYKNSKRNSSLNRKDRDSKKRVSSLKNNKKRKSNSSMLQAKSKAYIHLRIPLQSL
jgi:hypothetical protein